MLYSENAVLHSIVNDSAVGFVETRFGGTITTSESIDYNKLIHSITT